MKSTCYSICRLSLIIFVLLAIIFGNTVLASAKPIRVAVAPFKMNAEKDLSFLRDGIVDMLTSRLSWDDKVAVINRQETVKVLEAITAPLNESNAKEIGVKLGADYVLFGSLTVFGNSVSIDAKMVDVSGNKPALTFFKQSQGMDEIIPNINYFASDINEKVFGRTLSTRQVPAATAPRPTQTLQAQPDSRAHPEKLIVGGYDGSETNVQQHVLNPAFVTTPGLGKGSRQFWKSRNFKFLINGVALGDVDGDGKIETVIVTPKAVHIYRLENNRFYKAKELPEDPYRNIIGVDIADINGNGIPEIFVTSLNAHRNSVISFVLEYDGNNYIKIVKKSPWYYRVVEHPSRGGILFGQRQRTGGPDPFAEAIFEMAWENSAYEPTNKILPPRRANVMGFAYGNVLNDGQELAVAYSSSDALRIIASSGKVIWKGNENYGGSTLTFSLPQTSPGDPENRYLPMRILVVDLDADGKNEVIAVKNEESTGRRLAGLRHFTNAHIESFTWDGLGLASMWKARRISGHIRDCAIGDFDNDGQDELIAAVISKQGAVVLTTPKSSVISYDLNP